MTCVDRGAGQGDACAATLFALVAKTAIVANARPVLRFMRPLFTFEITLDARFAGIA
jgi:hypothetical protein